MASYVAVTGTPVEGQSTVFGLTPQELSYLKVNQANTLKTTESQMNIWLLFAVTNASF